MAQIVHRSRAVIVLEGPEGAGKKSLLKALGASFDPGHYNVHCITPDLRHSTEGPRFVIALC